MQTNELYNDFTVSRELKNVIYIPNIGRFCQCGCNKHITGRPDKRFYNSACRNRWCKKIGTVAYSYGSSKTLQAQISLNVENDGTRIIRLYLNKRVKKEIKISKKDSQLWKALDQIHDFRSMKKPMEVITA